MRSPSNIITFLSDFGHRDYFVAAVKGEILKINPQTKIIDITHDLDPFDTDTGAYLIESCFSNFPKGTVHLAVVDPGVGERDPVILKSEEYYFVGPDNGIFEPIMMRFKFERFVIKPGERLSSTFHARDLFGPTAAYLSLGRSPDALGKKALREIAKVTKGFMIIHIDRFGNLITNISARKSGYLLVKGQRIPIVRQYTDVEKGKLLAIVGSSGRLEISIREGSARDHLGVKRGEEIEHLD